MSKYNFKPIQTEWGWGGGGWDKKAINQFFPCNLYKQEN